MTLKELMESDIYKNSDYEIMKIEGKYGLREKGTVAFQDIYSLKTWYSPQYVREYCLGTDTVIIQIFMEKHKRNEKRKEVTKPLEIEEIDLNNNEINNENEIEAYKQKLMKGLE